MCCYKTASKMYYWLGKQDAEQRAGCITCGFFNINIDIPANRKKLVTVAPLGRDPYQETALPCTVIDF